MQPFKAKIRGTTAVVVIQEYDNALGRCALEKDQLIRAVREWERPLE